MEYQINRLVPRLIHCANNKSNFTFKHEEKLYTVSLTIDVLPSESEATVEDEDHDDVFNGLGLGIP